jgi:RimJ/RimL family protein N-acetyltransferase
MTPDRFSSTQKLREHDVVLEGRTSRGVPVRLRPMTEDDWGVLARWNRDPEVLHYSEGDDVTAYTLEEVQEIYRGVSRTAYCFIIEVGGRPIGEGWLQEMNVERILRAYPGRDCRRIDLMIGEKEYWGQGIGTEAIRLLTEFGFVVQRADAIFGCSIADYNRRSRRAFQKVGYKVVSKIRREPKRKVKFDRDLALTRAAFLSGLG